MNPPFKAEQKQFSLQDEPSSSFSTVSKLIDGSEEDLVLSKSQFLTRSELVRRRSRRMKQLARIYRAHYWALMEELKLKYRDYCLEFGEIPYQEEEQVSKSTGNRVDSSYISAENAQGNVNYLNARICGIYGCEAKAMAMTKFCHMHILHDARQRLYKACDFMIKSLRVGPILCGKPILRSTVPPYCPVHFQKAERHMAQALKKAGLNVSSARKHAPKFHVLIAEYVRQIQDKRRVSLNNKSAEC